MDSQRTPVPPHILALESAARIYCQRTAVDPNDLVPEPHPMLQGVEVHRPMWEIIAERMWDLVNLLRAMQEASAAAKRAEGVTQ